MSTDPEAILDFWFGRELDSPAELARRWSLWFGAEPSFDAAIQTRFGELPERAARGELDVWGERERSALALVLVLDQFPRNLYRNDPRAFAFDAQAQGVALAAVAAGFDHRAHPIEAGFFYMPLEHAEDLALQNRCVELFDGLAKRAPGPFAPRLSGFTDYARRHRAIIERFGRFPHRNAVLGRTPTPAETAYLAEGGETFAASRPRKVENGR